MTRHSGQQRWALYRARFCHHPWHRQRRLNGLDAEVALNLTAPIKLTGEVLHRCEGLSAIVFVTSGFALVSPTRAPTYGAVKAGLHAFAGGLRRQLTPREIHVLELLPTLTDTPGTAHESCKKMSTSDVADITLQALERE